MIFLLDATFPPQLARALQELDQEDCQYRHAPAEFGAAGKDETIFAGIREREWFLITLDAKMSKRPAQRQAIIDASLGVFVFTGSSLAQRSFREIGAFVLTVTDGILERARTRLKGSGNTLSAPPALSCSPRWARSTQFGTLSLVEGPVIPAADLKTRSQRELCAQRGPNARGPHRRQAHSLPPRGTCPHHRAGPSLRADASAFHSRDGPRRDPEAAAPRSVLAPPEHLQIVARAGSGD